MVEGERERDTIRDTVQRSLLPSRNSGSNNDSYRWRLTLYAVSSNSPLTSISGVMGVSSSVSM